MARWLLPVWVFLGASLFAFSSAASQKAPGACRLHQEGSFANSAFVTKAARGFNLPNWDDAPEQNGPKDKTLVKLFNHGLTHVRLPVFDKAFVFPLMRPKDTAPYLDKIRQRVLALNAIGYAVSIDLHPAYGFNKLYRESPDVLYPRLEEIWKRLVVHLRDIDPAMIAFELLNEPDISSEIWTDHTERLVEALRPLAPKHSLILSPAGPQRHETLLSMTPVADPNTIYAIHYYDPFIFTHQGASWLAEGDPVSVAKRLPFPVRATDPDVQRVIRDLRTAGKADAADNLQNTAGDNWGAADIRHVFKKVHRWSEKHNRPIIVNEFGTLSYHVAASARLRWIEAVVEAAEQECLGWTHWEYSDGFGFVDPETGAIDTDMLRIFSRKP